MNKTHLQYIKSKRLTELENIILNSDIYVLYDDNNGINSILFIKKNISIKHRITTKECYGIFVLNKILHLNMLYLSRGAILDESEINILHKYNIVPTNIILFDKYSWIDNIDHKYVKVDNFKSIMNKI